MNKKIIFLPYINIDKIYPGSVLMRKSMNGAPIFVMIFNGRYWFSYANDQNLGTDVEEAKNMLDNIIKEYYPNAIFLTDKKLEKLEIIL